MVSIFRLLRLAQKYWFYFLLALISLLATTTFNLAIPKILGYSVDHIVIGGQSKYIYIAVVAMISAYIFRGIFAYGQNYFGEVASQKMAYELRNNIFNHLQQLSFSYYDKAETGQLMSRATADVEAVRMFVSRTILNIIHLIVLLLAISTILFMINVKLALITMGFVPIIVILGILMSRRVGPMWLNVQQFLGIIATTLQENLVGVKVVKAFSRQEPECKRFYSDTKNLYDEYINVTKIRSFMVPLMIMLVSLPVAIILWYGGHEIINGRFTIGDLTQFIFYFGIMAHPIRIIGPMFNMSSRAASAGKRILDILDETDRIKESPDALILNNLKGSILFENVSFGYNTSAPILDNVSFHVKPGQLVALVGRSGSGKSTIISLIPRFYDVNTGRILIDDIDIRNLSLSTLRKNIGIVQQDTFLFAATIRENITYGAGNVDFEKVKTAAKAAQLNDFIEALPEGYNTWVGERGVTLSGGEKQRLSIARTLIINPPILIFDDSTSSIDLNTEYKIYSAISNLVRNRTTFIITNRLSIVKNADLILVLDNGRIIEQGNHNELMRKHGLYEEINRLQLSVSNIGMNMEIEDA